MLQPFSSYMRWVQWLLCYFCFHPFVAGHCILVSAWTFGGRMCPTKIFPKQIGVGVLKTLSDIFQISVSFACATCFLFKIPWSHLLVKMAFHIFFGRSYIELSSWQHFLGLSGGFAHGLGCLLSIQAGRSLGNAMAMSITRCQPLVCASWGVLVWGELNGAGYKTTLIFTGMLLMFLLALIFFLLATAGASWTSWNILQLCGKTSTSIYFRLLRVQYGPCCKASMDASSGITKLRMSSTATPWITFSLCWNLPGHDSPWFAFVVWSKRFCQMVVWARHVTRCPPWKSRWFPVDGRSCLYPMIDACSRALTNMEGLFVHSGPNPHFFANISRWNNRKAIHDRHEKVKLMLETCRAATRGASATPVTLHVRSFVWQSRWQSRLRSI